MSPENSLSSQEVNPVVSNPSSEEAPSTETTDDAAKKPDEPTATEAISTDESSAAAETPPASEPEVTPAPVAETPVQAESPAEPAALSEETTAPVEVETVSEATPEPVEPVASESSALTPEPPAATPEPAASETVEPEKARPRVQLNPTMNPTELKPVGNVPSTAPEKEETSVSATAVPKAEPVAIPDAGDIDDETQAEIAAALASGDLDSVSTVVETSGEDSKTTETPATTSESAPAPVAPTAPAMPASTPKDESTLEPGTKLKGIIQSVHGEDIILNVGYRLDALLGTKNFPEGKVPEVGTTIDVVVESVNQSDGLIHVMRMAGTKKHSGNWDALAEGQIVECTIEKTNKGGLQVQVSGLRGFMPASQIELGFVSDMEAYVGQKLQVKVLEVKPQKKNLVVSRKAILQEERKEAEADAWESLTVGEQRTGTVKTIKDYGAFVDIGGVDGLLHVGEISWNRVNHPSDVLKEGQQIDVKIITVDPGKKKIGLGMKQLIANPWDHVETKFAKGTTVTGRVTKTTDFGAFVEIEEGVEGLIHISELDYKRVNQVTDVLNVNQEVEVQVLEVNKNKKRISLSMKALKPKPEPKEPRPSDEDLAPGQGQPYERKRKTPLKGGSSYGTGAGLFGNPSDFEK